MNKRDFLIQGGGALMGVAATSAAWAAGASPAGGMQDADAPVEQGLAPAADSPAGVRARWHALLGETLTGMTPLGRPIELVVTEVSDGAAHLATQARGIEQFTVSLQGPRALPLQAGFHPLSHARAGNVQLYLEPVAQGECITYDAHFSLVA